MWNLIRKIERRKWLPRQKYGRWGVTGVFAVLALALILAVGWVIDRKGASAADRRLAAAARAAGEEPADAIVRALRARRIVFLSDIANSTATKQLAARAIAKLGETAGLDAVVLEIGADLQPFIEQYLDSNPENASLLMRDPRMLGGGSASRAYLELYRTVWRVNRRLGPDQRIRVVAADLPDWPPPAPAPGEIARLMSERVQHMEDTIEREILGTFPDARILVFVSGLQTLKSGSIAFQTGGSDPVEVTPLAARIGQDTEEVFSFLVDAPYSVVNARQVAPYVGTRVASVLREAGVPAGVVMAATENFGHVRQPIVEKNTPGMEYTIMPRDYRLNAVTDAYIYLGS